MSVTVTEATMVAGVCGQPIGHSMSPLIHNAWIAALGLDAVYEAYGPAVSDFEAFVEGLRGSGVRGLNVTIPFKERALALADPHHVSIMAFMAGAANLLTFEADGTIRADNTDGPGLLHAIGNQAPGLEKFTKPAVILGAGGAARGAVAALLMAGVPQVRIVNRTLARAQELVEAFGDKVIAAPQSALPSLLADVGLVINATSLGLGGGDGPAVQLDLTPADAVIVDMVYKPLRTEFLQRAQAADRRTVDGLEMLLCQAIPSFEAFYGQPPPPSTTINVRALALRQLGEV